MRSMAAVEAKNRFGELLDAAQREPITIERRGRAVAVVVSAEDHKQLEEPKLISLRREIENGLKDIKACRIMDGRKAIAALRRRLS